MFPIAKIPATVRECRSGKPPAPAHAACVRKKASAREKNAMMSYSSAPRSLLLAGAFFGAFTLSAAAQQPAAPPAAGAAARRRAAPLPPGSPLIGRPGQRSRRQARAGRAAAAAGRAGQAADGEAEGAGRLQHRGLCRRHGQRALARRRRQGHGVRRQPPRRQGLCHRQQGRQTRGQGAGLRPLPSERRRLQGRHALHRRTVEDLQDRQGRGQSRQSAEADRDLRQSAEGRGPRLEVHRHRSGQQALRSGRTARQQRAA